MSAREGAADGLAELVDALERLGDPLVNERSRRKILTVLRRTGEADFAPLLRLTGMSKGNLSNHLAKLEKSGYVQIGKRFEGKRPVTSARLSTEGRAAVEAYWREVLLLAGEIEGFG
jgi:DNA-binding transcriptional ArsR family regulator